VVAKRIQQLDQRLSIKENDDHITLKIGSSVAIVISSSGTVGFLIRSEDLLGRAQVAGLNLEKAPERYQIHKYKYLLRGLDLKAIQEREDLVREIVEESVRTASDRRRK